MLCIFCTVVTETLSAYLDSLYDHVYNVVVFFFHRYRFSKYLLSLCHFLHLHCVTFHYTYLYAHVTKYSLLKFDSVGLSQSGLTAVFHPQDKTLQIYPDDQPEKHAAEARPAVKFDIVIHRSGQDTKPHGDKPGMLKHLQPQLDMPLHIKFGSPVRYDEM